MGEKKVIKILRGLKESIEAYVASTAREFYNPLIAKDTGEMYFINEDSLPQPISIHYENIMKYSGANDIYVKADGTGDFVDIQSALEYLRNIEYTNDFSVSLHIEDDQVITSPILVNSRVFERVDILGKMLSQYAVSNVSRSTTTLTVTCSTTLPSSLVGKVVQLSGNNQANRGLYKILTVSTNKFTAVCTTSQVNSTVAGTITLVTSIKCNDIDALIVSDGYKLKSISCITLEQVADTPTTSVGLKCGDADVAGGHITTGADFGIYNFYNGLVAHQNGTVNSQGIVISKCLNAGIIASRGAFIKANNAIVTRNTAIGIRAENGATVEGTGSYVISSTTALSPNKGSVGNYGGVIIP